MTISARYTAIGRKLIAALLLVFTMAAPASATNIFASVVGEVTDGRNGSNRDGVADSVSRFGGFPKAYIDSESDEQSEVRVVFEFDITPFSLPVTDARLIVPRDANGDVPTFAIYGYAGDGNLTVDDFGLNGFTLIFGPAFTVMVSFDVTSHFNSLIGQTNFFGINMSVIDEGSSLSFYTPGSFFPLGTHLVVTPTPVAAAPAPTTPALLGLGLAGLGLSRRRRANQSAKGKK